LVLNNMQIKKSLWGVVDDQQVYLYTIRQGGVSVTLSNYGALIQSLCLKDKRNILRDVVLGFDALEDYISDECYIGVVPAIYANRIANGCFELNGQSVSLECDDGDNSLHAGKIGKKVWSTELIEKKNVTIVIFSIRTDSGFHGFPEGMLIQVIYSLDEVGVFNIVYEAVTKKDTIINLTNHTYFNLGEEDILLHELTVNSNSILATDINNIPTGEFRSVKGTPFDFRIPKTIGKDINSNDYQIKSGAGYDVNYIINKNSPLKVSISHPITGDNLFVDEIANLKSAETGISLEILGSQPGVQFYSGNYLKNNKGKLSCYHGRYKGVCLETQHYPDSPNHSDFPSCFLRKGGIYQHVASYSFSIE
jgi:aldose 1-epimerase